MKTNLHAKFATNESFETEGIWVELGEGAAIRVKRYGGQNAQALMQANAKWRKPFAKEIELKTLSPEKNKEISVRVFVDTCVADWRGIKTEKDGQLEEIVFSKENAYSLFKELPDLMDVLLIHAADANNYRDELVNSSSAT